MRQIEWTASALTDVKSLREFISRDSRAYSERFVQRLIDVVENAANYPMMGRAMPEAVDENIRELFFQKYRIVYRVEAYRIVVLMVIHGSRDLNQLDIRPWEIAQTHKERKRSTLSSSRKAQTVGAPMCQIFPAVPL